MTTPFTTKLREFESRSDIALLNGNRIGVEKESLRTDPDGRLAQTPHPQGLGSALTNPHITTDFSEALLEFVTPAHREYWKIHQYLCDLHTFAYAQMGPELLWVASMPCRLGSAASIPLARYGRSNVGKMKTVYRRGLGLRYGRLMQTIAGLHFNFSVAPDIWPQLQGAESSEKSLDDYRSDRYLGLIRNFRRSAWLILYLFGASPAVCKSFIDDPYSVLPDFDKDTLFEPYATSLRMSDLGYSNKNQSRLSISLNSVSEYVADLSAAISTVEPEYQRLGVEVNGRYRQLNANLLQIENEYYSPMRPKRVAHSGERPTAALRRGGIEYVELRSLDLNPFEPLGISQRQARFVEIFLLHCLIADSPLLDADELAQCQANDALTARSGRDPGLLLRFGDEETLLTSKALSLFDELAMLADVMDKTTEGGEYAGAVQSYRESVVDTELTPSAQVLREMSDNKQSFFEMGLSLAERTKSYIQSLAPINDARMAELAAMADASIAEQVKIETADAVDFGTYLQRYFTGNPDVTSEA